MASTESIDNVTEKELIASLSESFVLGKDSRVSGEVVKNGESFHFRRQREDCKMLVRENRGYSSLGISYSL